MTGLWCQVFKKADRGAWDEGAELRDERVVSECTDIIAFDESSRVKRYCDLAKRMTGRKVWFVSMGEEEVFWYRVLNDARSHTSVISMAGVQDLSGTLPQQICSPKCRSEAIRRGLEIRTPSNCDTRPNDR
jgi:hypothetical protein